MVTTATLTSDVASSGCDLKLTSLKNGIHNRNKNGGLNGSANGVKFRKEITYALFETDTEKVEEVLDEVTQIVEQQTESVTETKSSSVQAKPKKYQLVWINILAMVFLHSAAGAGILMIPYAKIQTIFWTYVCLLLGTLGVQAGAHRLWAHKTYKANFGLRLFLSLCHVLALQNDIYEWSRDHRAHHKFADTDGDPHDSSKGFFFSHVGWLLVKKHPDVIRRGKTLHMADLKQDPVVVFQRKFYIPMVIVFWGMIPTFVPVLLWGESLIIAGTICVFTRYVVSLNLTWCVNSWAHIFGYKPYDTRLDAVEASIRHVLMGEGFHNYHHAFPWDYSASELGAFDVFNPATAAIDFFHWMGWAWDLKKVNSDMINKKKQNTGDPAFYHKRNTAAYEWVTGLLTMALPLVTMIVAHTIFHKQTNYFDVQPWIDWALN